MKGGRADLSPATPELEDRAARVTDVPRRVALPGERARSASGGLERRGVRVAAATAGREVHDGRAAGGADYVEEQVSSAGPAARSAGSRVADPRPARATAERPPAARRSPTATPETHLSLAATAAVRAPDARSSSRSLEARGPAGSACWIDLSAQATDRLRLLGSFDRAARVQPVAGDAARPLFAAASAAGMPASIAPSCSTLLDATRRHRRQRHRLRADGRRDRATTRRPGRARMHPTCPPNTTITAGPEAARPRSSTATAEFKAATAPARPSSATLDGGKLHACGVPTSRRLEPGQAHAPRSSATDPAGQATRRPPAAAARSVTAQTAPAQPAARRLSPSRAPRSRPRTSRRSAFASASSSASARRRRAPSPSAGP